MRHRAAPTWAVPRWRGSSANGTSGGAVGGGRVQAGGGLDVAVALGELRVDELAERVVGVEAVAGDDARQVDERPQLVGGHPAGQAPGQQVVHLGRCGVALLGHGRDQPRQLLAGARRGRLAGRRGGRRGRARPTWLRGVTGLAASVSSAAARRSPASRARPGAQHRQPSPVAGRGGARIVAPALLEHLEGGVEIAVGGGERRGGLDARVGGQPVEPGDLGVLAHPLARSSAGVVEPARHAGQPHERLDGLGGERVVAGAGRFLGGLLEEGSALGGRARLDRRAPSPSRPSRRGARPRSRSAWRSRAPCRPTRR